MIFVANKYMQNKPGTFSAIERLIVAAMILIVLVVAIEGVLQATVKAEAQTLHQAGHEYIAFKQMQRREAGLASFGTIWTTERPR